MACIIRITAPHFTAGVIEGGRTAPILAYMAKWPRERIESYCRRKGWSYEVIEADAPDHTLSI